mmetsp:Transcript_26642/g.46443  ORF Transcript_26642/g.46443 Transcript_26642/m.46443 type:complete len:370 (-) Transcript_26642:163-1272(-)
MPLSLLGGKSFKNHNNFWKPISLKIVAEILTQKAALPSGDARKSVVMLWWGGESLKTKRFLQKVLPRFESAVDIHHIEHCNPAAQGDLFCKAPHFSKVNARLSSAGLPPIDWLPDREWLAQQEAASGGESSRLGDFILETRELHKMYLERLQAGLQCAAPELAPIDGVLAHPLLHLPDACRPLNLVAQAEAAVRANEGGNDGGGASAAALDAHERGAVYLYTGNALYFRLNQALRDQDRARALPYYGYLRLFLEAYGKLASSAGEFYRGIRKDLTREYREGSTVTWWSVSSCTPNLGVARSFGGGSDGGTLFRIRCKAIVPIMEFSAYKGEEEYILPPGTQLTVTKVSKRKGAAAEIFLEQTGEENLVR